MYEDSGADENDNADASGANFEAILQEQNQWPLLWIKYGKFDGIYL